MTLIESPPTVPRRDLALPGAPAAPGAIVWVRGEHDACTAPALWETVHRAIGCHDADLVLDMSDVTFLDASTVSVVIRAHRHLRGHSRSMTVRSPSRCARRVLELCGLAALIEIPRAARVLYIDGNPENIRLMNGAFDRWPHLRLETAVDGAAGLEHIRRRRPDLVLVDGNVVERYGIGLLRRIRALPTTGDLAVMVISSDARLAQAVGLLGLGVDEYLVRPFASDHLGDLVDRLTRSRGPNPGGFSAQGADPMDRQGGGRQPRIRQGRGVAGHSQRYPCVTPVNRGGDAPSPALGTMTSEPARTRSQPC